MSYALTCRSVNGQTLDVTMLLTVVYTQACIWLFTLNGLSSGYQGRGVEPELGIYIFFYIATVGHAVSGQAFIMLICVPHVTIVQIFMNILVVFKLPIEDSKESPQRYYLLGVTKLLSVHHVVLPSVHHVVLQSVHRVVLQSVHHVVLPACWVCTMWCCRLAECAPCGVAGLLSVHHVVLPACWVCTTWCCRLAECASRGVAGLLSVHHVVLLVSAVLGICVHLSGLTCWVTVNKNAWTNVTMKEVTFIIGSASQMTPAATSSFVKARVGVDTFQSWSLSPWAIK